MNAFPEFSDKDITPVLKAFGALSDEGQKDLRARVRSACTLYQAISALPSEEEVPSSERNRLVTIQSTARRLLFLLGIDNNATKALPDWGNASFIEKAAKVVENKKVLWLLRAGLFSPKETAFSEETAAKNIKMMAETLFCLQWLAKQAKEAANTIPVCSGRGGTRRGVSPQGTLLRSAIKTYDILCKKFLDRKRKIADGGPLYRFVQAVEKLAGAKQSPKTTISSALSAYKRNTIPISNSKKF
jgi:hypothetical protein